MEKADCLLSRCERVYNKAEGLETIRMKVMKTKTNIMMAKMTKMMTSVMMSVLPPE